MSRTDTTSSRNLALVLAGIVVAALVMAIATTSGKGDTAPTASAFGAPEVSGDALPTLRNGGDPAVGTPAPVVTGIGVDGEQVTIGSGGPQVIAFLAHWCPHCRAEVPVVVDWLDQGRLPDGVALLSVATSTDEGQPNFPPQDWLAREQWTAPVLLDDEDDVAARAYGVSSFPFWTVVDADGNVVLRVTGELTPDQLDVLFQLALRGPAAG